MSAPRCMRPFRALWCMTVLATHRSFFRAVVDDVAETRTTHAIPALAQRNPERLRSCRATLLVHLGWPTRTSGSATTNFTSWGDLRNYQFHRPSGRELCP